MNLVDFHLHTSFSSDSKAEPYTMIEQAAKLGLSAICITDHNDFDYPKNNGKTEFFLELDAYMEKLLSLKHAYKDKIDVYIGIEQGLTTNAPERIETYADKYGDILDFIIGSSHMVNNIDPYFEKYWDNKTASDGICLYLESILENLKVCSNFDVYGHIDYIIRYIPKRLGSYDYNNYLDLYEAIFKKLIEKGKGIEINTSGFKYGLSNPHPCIELIKLYRNLGGEIITIGSDAHKPEHIAYAFDMVPKLLSSAGFNYYTIFEKRKPKFCKIS